MFGGVNRLIRLICSTTSTVSMGSATAAMCVCVCVNQFHSPQSHTVKLCSSFFFLGGGGWWRWAEWQQSSSSFSVIKPERGLFFPANYVEITKTIKHLLVFLSPSRFPQYCDRLMYCGRVQAPGAQPPQSWGQQRANRWIYNFGFSRRRSRIIVCPPSLCCSTPETTTYSEDTHTETNTPSFSLYKAGEKECNPPHPHQHHPGWQATLVKAPCFLIPLCFHTFSHSDGPQWAGSLVQPPLADLRSRLWVQPQREKYSQRSSYLSPLNSNLWSRYQKGELPVPETPSEAVCCATQKNIYSFKRQE